METDQQKLEFIERAMDMPDPFSKCVQLDRNVMEALCWLEKVTPEQVNWIRAVSYTHLRAHET